MFFIGYIFDIFISQDPHPPGIIRVHPVHPCSSHGFDPTIHRYRYRDRYRYRNITAFPVCPVCVQRLSALSACNAQAGVPTAQVEDTNPKRTISIESPPCRPGAKDEATSFRKTSDPSNWQRIDSDSDPDSEKNESRRLNPLPPPLGALWERVDPDHASPYRYIDRPTQRRQSARQVRGVPTRNKVGRSLVAHAAPGGHVPLAQARAVFF